MRRVVAASWSALLALALTFFAAAVHADERTTYLIEQLKTNEDYRVRTQAALALGAGGDGAAVAPLCGALSDSNASVKVASAAALGKLGNPAGLPCLRAAEAKEAAPSVKAQLQKSIASLEEGGGGGATPAAPGMGTKFYVAIQVTNKTSRPTADVETLVRGAMQAKLVARPAYAVAPKLETPIQGGQVVKSKSLKGFLLIAAVEPPRYDGGNLTQVVRVSMWTYPDKALQGEFSPKLTQAGTSSGDTESENVLMKMCAESAVETFQKVTAAM